MSPRTRNVPPRRVPNATRRPREYLLPSEVAHLCNAARRCSRYGQRNALLILLMYQHGLRVGEVVRLAWAMVDLAGAELHVVRSKRGTPAVHPLTPEAHQGLTQLHAETGHQPFVFLSERGQPFRARGVHTLIARAGQAANLPFPVHPHMLRHACGFKLAQQGVDTRALQAFLGHRNIQHTVRYTEITSARFRQFWTD